jgi:pyridinium-3,5-bisthiocarboxylic acid mononucleotide nickel chelatase
VSVKQTSLKIFQKLAEAEARVHGTTIEEVHFHEVGAVDSILDIVGAAVGLEYFNIHSVFSSALPLGTGQINTQHGLLPLPAPATMELLRMVHAPVTPSKATVELVTPTGAAILAALATFSQPEMKLRQVGIGAGRRDLEWPNVLRLLIGDQIEPLATHLEIETNIDDMNPQIFGHVMAKLFQVGALDVYFTPIFMKKNRPATKLSVIARQEDELIISNLLLRETSTLGVRVKPVRRHEAERQMRTIETRYGQVPLKLKILDGEILQASPEFDVCVLLADHAGVPVAQVLQEAAFMSQEFLNLPNHLIEEKA